MSAEKRWHDSYLTVFASGTGLVCGKIVDDAQASFFSDLIQPITCFYLDCRSAILTHRIQSCNRQFCQRFSICAASGVHGCKDAIALCEQFTITYPRTAKVKFFRSISSKDQVRMSVYRSRCDNNSLRINDGYTIG